MEGKWQAAGKWVATLLLVFGAGLMWSDSGAQDCLDPPIRPDFPTLGNPLPGAVRDMIAITYPEFGANFSILVYWEVSDEPQTWNTWPWPLDDEDGEEGILDFIEAVMPSEESLPGQDMYDHSVWWRVCKYFGLDVSATYDAVPFLVFDHYSTGYVSEYYSHYYINITPAGGDGNAGEGSWNSGDCFYGFVDLPLPHAGPVNVHHMAYDAFAHEYTHVLQSSMHTAYPLYSGTGIEYWPQCSEYLNGSTWYDANDYYSQTPLAFTRGLLPGDYYESCLGHDQGHKHHTFNMFAPYLIEHYALGGDYVDDALHKWIRQKEDPNQQTDWPTRNDLKALANMLDHDDYDPFFMPITGGDARVRRMFQTYALSTCGTCQQL